MQPVRNSAEPTPPAADDAAPQQRPDPLHLDPHREEAVNAATHAVGLAAALAGVALLFTRAGARQADPWQLVGLAVYAVTLVSAYAASTLSHAFRQPRPRHAWRVA